MEEKKQVIKSIGYNQHEMLYNIMQMHNGGKPFDVDITYSVGNFYGVFNIIDFKDVKVTSLLSKNLLKYLNESTNIMQNYYPESIANI